MQITGSERLVLYSEESERRNLVCVFNMAPVERKDFTIGVPVAAVYEEIWNTELEEWGGVWKEHNQDSSVSRGIMEDYEQTLTFYLAGFRS